jgi:hypothetical protein
LSFTKPILLQAPRHISAHVDWTESPFWTWDRKNLPLLKTRSMSTKVAVGVVGSSMGDLMMEHVPGIDKCVMPSGRDGGKLFGSWSTTQMCSWHSRQDTQGIVRARPWAWRWQGQKARVDHQRCSAWWA